MKRKAFLIVFFLGYFHTLLAQINSNQNEIAIKWAKATIDFINLQPNKSPTFISRSLAYSGITMYESVVKSNSKFSTIQKELNGSLVLSKPQKGKKYDWITVLNAAQPEILKKIWQPLADKNGLASVAKVDSLEAIILKERILIFKDTTIINRSVLFGKQLANEIFEWSKTDGGHEMNFKSFDKTYQLPKGEGFWVPPRGGQSPILLPLHPYWGNNRTFVKSNAVLPIPKMIPYSKDTASAYFKQFKEVYDLQNSLSQEMKEIAIWWGDDPLFTAAPPGHSYNLAIKLIQSNKADLVLSAMTFAKVGIASADAFINCWKCKFTYHSERPPAFIKANIYNRFGQFWPEPPFPGFPSGHSTQIAAVAAVLIDIYGDNQSIEDDTYLGRQGDGFRKVEYKTRRFIKISQIAEECGISRLYGGIHTKQDNEVGLAEGYKIGKNINLLKWGK